MRFSSPDITNKIKSGAVINVQLDIQRSFSQYKRHNRKIYVGITNNPDKRLTEHRNRSSIRWERMIVIYQTSSDKNVKNIESLITSLNFDRTENKVIGGGGRTGSGPYYLYFLLKK